MKRKQDVHQVRWDLALRYRLIETVVWWEGRLTTGHLIQSFGISRQQASKDINTYMTEHAPKNLTYDKQLKGYTPSKHFKPLFIEDSASAYLHLLNQTHSRAPHVEGLALAYAHTMVLEVPDRTIKAEVLRPLLKACRNHEVISVEYVPLANPVPETRLIAPHTLVHTGMRWHVRAYCEKNRGYRDFVLSRLRGQPDYEKQTENLIHEDDDWNTEVAVIIEPDSRLNPAQKAIIEADFGMQAGVLVIPTRRALVKYVLQRFQIDPKKLDPKAAAQQIVVKNLDDLKPWLYE